MEVEASLKPFSLPLVPDTLKFRDILKAFPLACLPLSTENIYRTHSRVVNLWGHWKVKLAQKEEEGVYLD